MMGTRLSLTGSATTSKNYDEHDPPIFPEHFFDGPEFNPVKLADEILRKHRYITPRDTQEIYYYARAAESAMRLGMDGYMRKEAEPGHYKAMSRRIRHIVEKRRAGKAVAEETRAPLLDASRP